MTQCLCCGNLLLRQVSHHRVYWFCRTCWQEMPHLEATMIVSANVQRSGSTASWEPRLTAGSLSSVRLKNG